MAMTSCKECGKEISDQAKVCPNCGIELKKIGSKREVLEYRSSIKDKREECLYLAMVNFLLGFILIWFFGIGLIFFFFSFLLLFLTPFVGKISPDYVLKLDDVGFSRKRKGQEDLIPYGQIKKIKEIGSMIQINGGLFFGKKFTISNRETRQAFLKELRSRTDSELSLSN